MNHTAIRAGKRAFFLALTVLLAALLVGCGHSAPDAEPSAAQSAGTEAAVPSENSAEPTTEPTAEPTPEPTAEPVEYPLGKELTVGSDTERLTLKPEDFTYDALLEALPSLSALKELTLEDCALSIDELDALREAASEELKLDWSVKLLGKSLPSDTQELDLSGIKGKDLNKALKCLKLLPELKSIELMDQDGACALEKKDVRKLMDALPGTQIHYCFELFGKTLSTLDETVEYEKIKLLEEDEAELREALDILPNCTRFVLDKDFRGMSDEALAQIREDYPEQGVVWRVYFPGSSVQTSAEVSALTDEEILRITFILNDYNSGPLKYCTNAVYVDIGHNSPVSDISFVENMPRLECFIGSGSNIHDLSAFAKCPNLTWLEFCFCPKVVDLSPLKDHPTLKYLNVSYSGVTDITALENVPLERLVTFHCKVPKEQQEAFVEKHPDCLAGFVGEQPYGFPWRYNDGIMGSSNFFEYYIRMRELFIYDDRNYVNNSRNNKYGPGYIELRPYNLVYDENGKLRTTTPYLEQKAAQAAAEAAAKG